MVMLVNLCPCLTDSTQKLKLKWDLKFDFYFKKIFFSTIHWLTITHETHEAKKKKKKKKTVYTKHTEIMQAED